MLDRIYELFNEKFANKYNATYYLRIFSDGSGSVIASDYTKEPYETSVLKFGSFNEAVRKLTNYPYQDLNLTDDEDINKALNIAFRYGQIDGSHHKLWVIDQMVRALCDSDKKYAEFIKEYSSDDEGNEYTWETGVAP